MPRLLVFAICQKAIIDGLENNVSMIALTNSLAIEVPKDQLVPVDAIAPFSWGMVAAFFREPGDQGKTFQTKIQFTKPNKDVHIIIESGAFVFHESSATTATTSFGIPIGEEGMCTVTLYLRIDNGEWQEIADAPFEIVYKRTETEAKPTP